MKENAYQTKIIKKLERLFPGCIVIKNDSGYIQGIPDITILFKDRWAMLEIKRSSREQEQPNQSYYVSMLNEMSYSSFIFPENEERVFNELQHAFNDRG